MGQLDTTYTGPVHTAVSVINTGHVSIGNTQHPSHLWLVPDLPPYILFGRAQLLLALVENLCTPGKAPRVLLVGAAGTGKTAIAIALAHNSVVRTNFAVLLWAGLGRYSNVSAQLVKWATHLGIVLGDESKWDASDLKNAIVRQLAGRRVLFFIDDAWNQSDLEMLRFDDLVGCGYVVTTRRKDLRGQAHCVATDITELDCADSHALLNHFAPAAILSDPEKTAVLIRESGGLPLALMLIANKLRLLSLTGTQTQVSDTLTALIHALHRVELEDADPDTAGTPQQTRSLKAAIALGIDVLKEHSRLALYALSLFPPKPNTFSEQAFRAITGMPDEILQSLVTHSLVEKTTASRFTIHRLIAMCANQDAQVSAGEWSATAKTAFINFAVKLVTDSADGIECVATEWENISRALTLAADLGNPNVFRLLANLHPVIIKLGLYRSEPLDYVLDQAQMLADRGVASPKTFCPNSINDLATIALLKGEIAEKRARYPDAVACLASLLTYEPQLTDKTTKTRVAELRALLEADGCHFDSAMEILSAIAATPEYFVATERIRFMNVLRRMGEIEMNRGNFEAAGRFLSQGIELATSSPERSQEALSGLYLALASLAFARSSYAEADSWASEGLKHIESTHYERLAGLCHIRAAAAHNLAERCREARRYVAAKAHLEIARRSLNVGIEAARKISHAWYLSSIYIECGEYYRKSVRRNVSKWYIIAARYFDRAIRIAETIDVKDRKAFALFSRARMEGERKQFDLAQKLARKSLDLFTQMRHFMMGSAKELLNSLVAADKTPKSNYAVPMSGMIRPDFPPPEDFDAAARSEDIQANPQ